jgi:ABC-type sugar transport system ATPase subunit
MTLRGAPVKFTGPLDARSKGVEAVYQSLALAPNLCAADNIYLGREKVKKVLGVPWIRRLDERAMYASTAEVISRLKVNIPDLRGIPVGQMSGGQQQCVAIARAAHWASDVLFMDEPTAALGLRESQAVLDLVVSIKEQGVAVVMISHILPHVIDLADNVVVMRHGRKAATLTKDDLSMDGLVRLIVGIEEG